MEYQLTSLKIVDKGSYSELEARDIVRQLVEGVDYLHNQGIAHRDLKVLVLLLPFL
jgi:serine/threonine protein kinase